MADERAGPRASDVESWLKGALSEPKRGDWRVARKQLAVLAFLALGAVSIATLCAIAVLLVSVLSQEQQQPVARAKTHVAPSSAKPTEDVAATPRWRVGSSG